MAEDRLRPNVGPGYQQAVREVLQQAVRDGDLCSIVNSVRRYKRGEAPAVAGTPQIMGAAMAPQSSTRAAVVADDEAKRHCECEEEMCSSPAGTAGLALASVPPCRDRRGSGSTLVRSGRVWTR